MYVRVCALMSREVAIWLLMRLYGLREIFLDYLYDT